MPPRKKAKIRNSTDNSVNWLNDIHTSSARKSRRHTTYANIYDIPGSPEPPEQPEPLEGAKTLRDRLRSRQNPPSTAESLQSNNEQHISPSGDEQMDDASEHESHDEDAYEPNGSLVAYQGSYLGERDPADDQEEEQRQITQEVIQEDQEQEKQDEGGQIREEWEQEQEEQDDDDREEEDEADNDDDNDNEDEDEREERFSTPHHAPRGTPKDRSNINGTLDNSVSDVQQPSFNGSQNGSLVSKNDASEMDSRITSVAQTNERQESTEHEYEPEDEPVEMTKRGPENRPEDEPVDEPEDESEDEDIARLDSELKDWLVKTVETTDPNMEWMKFHDRAFDLPNYVCRPMPKSFEDALLLIARQRELYVDLEDRSVTEGLPPRFQTEISNLCTSVFSEIQGILNFPSIPDSQHNPVKAGRLIIQLEGYLLPHMAILVILGFKAFTEFGISATNPFAEILKLLQDCCDRINDLRDYYTSSRNRQRSWRLGVSTKRIKTALEDGKLNIHLPAGALKEETETGPSSLGHWTYAEVVALRYALQTYHASNRYVLIKMHYGTELSRHTIQDLKLKARELGLK